MTMISRLEPRYVSIEDAQTRLNGVIVMYRGVPVMLMAHDGYSFTIAPLDKRDVPSDVLKNFPETVNVNTDQELDFDIPSLGYVNDKQNDKWDPIFLARNSHRRFMQGLCVRNVHYLRESLGQGFDPHLRNNGVLFAAPNAISKCLLNKYPTARTAWEVVHDKEHLGLAFNKNFCFSKLREHPDMIRLRYMKRTVGIVDRAAKSPEILVLPEFKKYSRMISEIVSDMPNIEVV